MGCGGCVNILSRQRQEGRLLCSLPPHQNQASYLDFNPADAETKVPGQVKATPVKLNSFKGNIATCDILPLNQAILFGSDTGTLSLWA